MPENYSSWSVEKLKKERQKIDKAINQAEKRDKKATLAKMATIARQNGFELHELLSEPGARTKSEGVRKTRRKKKPAGTRAKVQPKYRNPDDHAQTWTGRGRQPLWVKTQLESGVGLDRLKIPEGSE